MATCRAAANGSPQTFVVCLRCPAAAQPSLVAGLQLFGTGLILQEHLPNVAIAQIDDCVYFLVSEAHQRRADNAQRHWTTMMQKVTCSDLRKLPEVATIAWVRPFNRHLQRLLGLGDAHATKADVVNAVRQEDEDELRAIMPGRRAGRSRSAERPAGTARCVERLGAARTGGLRARLWHRELTELGVSGALHGLRHDR